MSSSFYKLIQLMNVLSVVLFLLCCLHSMHSKAESSNGAITVVQQEDTGGTTVEDDGEEEKGSSEKKVPVDVFIPTHEWQTVKEGQAIPPGLHVQMSLQTGKKEAKLMDGDSGAKYWRTADQREGMLNADRKQFTVQELKRALKDFKTTKLEETDLKREDEVLSQFRKYEDLKKDFEAINMNIETDGEIVTRLVESLKKPDLNKDKHLLVLRDLEYYLHQIDNGVLFKDLGGIPLLLKAINKTGDEELQIEATMTLGTAASLNPKVQVTVLDSGGLQTLLPILSTSKSMSLQRKVMFALSSLCRHFPYAQHRFLELGGLSAVGRLVQDPSSSDKLKIKVVTFLTDLLTEKIDVEAKTDHQKTTEVEKLRQYEQVPLLETMVEQGWCQMIPGLLNMPDHASREPVLKTMKILGSSCGKDNFLSAAGTLQEMKAEYMELAQLEDENQDSDRYFSHMLEVVSDLISTLNPKDEL